MSGVMQRFAFRFISILVGVVAATAAIEAALRIIYPDSGIPAAHRQNMSPEALALFTTDPEAGYLIAPGTGAYGPEGCLRNDYDVARRRGTRVLFVGDSVTHRGKVIDAVRRLYGEAGYEYWNAGVEGFNTRQELVLYRRHNAAIRPDHVVLGFHPNDFNATPIVVFEKGEMRVFQQSPNINPWWFTHSYLYRWAWPRSEVRDRAARAAGVFDSLREFKTLLAQQHIRFSVVLWPVLKPMDAWAEEERWARDRALAIFAELDLRVLDLLTALQGALGDGVIGGEEPGDTWHPSDAMAERFAQELARQRLLQ